MCRGLIPERKRWIGAARISVVAVLLLTGAFGNVDANAQLSEQVQKQIAEVAAFKNSFSPAEQKMSFNLVLVSRAAHHHLKASLARLINRSELDSNGDAVVQVNGYLTASLLSNRAMAGVEKTNGQVAAHAFTSGKVQAHVHPNLLLELASQSDVKSLSGPELGTTNAGALTSQGYVSHGVNKAIGLGVTGAGVRVGVMSDSASAARVASLIASGDLPADTVVVSGQAGPSSGEDEGTAMMEIVHDMAPDAKLVFATAASGQSQFAANIRALRFTYHCDIIVDDYTYFFEAAFQDDVIAKAVNDVTADGAMYFSSAANSGNLTQGQSGTWEGDFLAGINEVGSGVVHNFGTAASPIYSNALSAAATTITLGWADPIGGATDDYDLYLVNAAGTTLLAVSAGIQNGTQDPIEGFSAASGTSFPAGSQVVVLLNYGTPRAMHLDTHRGRLSIGTAGSTYGHNAGLHTFSTAAVYWNSAHTGAKLFTGGVTNPIETFSSDGPRKIFFNPDGTPITPGNFLFGTNGGQTLQKPDAAAADGVTTKTPGFNPFFGTSAAAPHAAGIAALVKSANPSLSAAQVYQILINTTLDNMGPGTDRDSGYGILMALPAVQSALATAQMQ